MVVEAASRGSQLCGTTDQMPGHHNVVGMVRLAGTGGRHAVASRKLGDAGPNGHDFAGGGIADRPPLRIQVRRFGASRRSILDGRRLPPRFRKPLSSHLAETRNGFARIAHARAKIVAKQPRAFQRNLG